MKTESTFCSRASLLAACAIGLAVWALRVALVGAFGIGIPKMDQWQVEGLKTYEPWISGQFSWAMIFESHVEHRIAWTHLWNLLLFKLCGQWDPMVQMVTQALITAVTAGCCVWGLLGAQRGWLWRSAVILGALIAFGSPYAHQNILWGFQSCFAIYLALSLGVCGATALAWSNRRYIWLALLAGLAAPLAMGAGLLIGPVIGAMGMLVILNERKLSGRSCGVLAVGVLCLAFGLFLRSDAPGTQYAYAKSVAQFGKAWLAACAWPNSQMPVLAGLACLPAAIFTMQVIFRQIRPCQPGVLFIIGVFVWSVACAASGAWVRGGLGPIPPSRYHDFLALLCWANLLALVLVLRAWWTTGGMRLRVAGGVITLAWLAVTTHGGTRLLQQIFQKEMPRLRTTLGYEYTEFNERLEGNATNALPAGEPVKEPKAHETVMASRVLAPYLPPELQRPPAGITPEGLLMIAPAVANCAWQWQSGEFVTPQPAMVVFVEGDPHRVKLALIDPATGKREWFQPSGRSIGEWGEWLVLASPGRYRLGIETQAVPDGVGFILPRPVSAAGYWSRSISSHGLFLLELAGLCLALAFYVSRKTDTLTPGSISPV